MLILILGIAVILASGFVSYFEKASDNKKEKKSNKYNAGALILICLGSLIAFKSGCDSESDKKVATQRADSVNNIITKKQDSIQGFAENIRSMQAKIIALQSNQLDTAQDILLKQNLIVKSQIKQLNTTNDILSENIKLHKPVQDNFKISFQIVFKSEYYSKLYESLHLQEVPFISLFHSLNMIL